MGIEKKWENVTYLHEKRFTETVSNEIQMLDLATVFQELKK